VPFKVVDAGFEVGGSVTHADPSSVGVGRAGGRLSGVAPALLVWATYTRARGRAKPCTISAPNETGIHGRSRSLAVRRELHVTCGITRTRW
jgi:hypothetical protein